MEAYLGGIMSRDIPFYWDAILPLIEKALEKSDVDDLNVASIYDRLRDKHAQLWIGTANSKKLDFFGITEIYTNSDNEQECFITLIGGAHLFTTFSRYITYVEEWARENDCSRLSARCRKGIEKLLVNEYDYEVTGNDRGRNICTKELEG